MKLSKRRKPQSRDNSMIPLINIVFLMLAFFMIAGQIQRSSDVHLELPESLNQADQGEYTATLLITRNQSLYLDDVPLQRERLTQAVARLFESAASPDAVRVLVKADAALPAEELRQILALLRASGLLRVSLATEPKLGAT